MEGTPKAWLRRLRPKHRVSPVPPVPPGPIAVVELPVAAVVAAPAVRGCLAPETSMRFNPDGMVTACCVNSRFPLGHIAQASIREIWQGGRARTLAEAVAADDYSLGCQECAAEIEVGNRDASYAPTFDQFAPAVPTAWPQRLEFAISNRCNLMCVQCTGNLSSAIRNRREHRPPVKDFYGEAFFDELPPFLAEARSTVFLGGEPFLQPGVWRIWDQLLAMDSSIRPTVDVTTNGTIWNDRVEHYVRDLAMSVAVSLDAVDAEMGEAIRVGSKNDEVMRNLRRLRSLVAETDSGFGINSCLMRENWRELPALLELGDEVDADVEVILITYPHERSMLLLPPGELDAVVTELELLDAAMQERLVRNRATWDAVLLRLRSHARGSAGVPVGITARPTGTEFMISAQVESILHQLDREQARLASERNAMPCEAIAVDGVVDEVVEQAWAADLQVPSWIGSPVDQLIGLFGSTFDADASVEIFPLDDLLRAEITVADRRYDVIVGEWIDADNRRWLRALVSEAVS